MGKKLDEAHQELTRIAAALRAHPVGTLDEAAKKPVFRKPPPPGQSRKDRKQQAKQEKLYGGKEPLGTDFGKPYQPPAARPKPLKEQDAGLPERLEKLRAMLRLVGAVSGRQRLDSDVAIPRTLVALQITEERSSTTFSKCKEGAMLSTAHLRHRIPKNQFVKPDKDNPTLPVRPGCRASNAALGRAIQKDMGDADEATAQAVIRRVNSVTGGTRGAGRLKLWGTGVGGQRMETFRGPPGTPKRTETLAKKLGISKKEASKLHGISTGRPDNQKHTTPYSPPGGSKGPAGNREVPRHPLAHAKPPSKETGKKTKRTEKREAGKIGRGLARIGR